LPPARAILYAATLSVLGFVAHTVLRGPPTLSVAALVFVLYAALFLSGVFFIRLRMFADALTRGPVGSKGVALTFDDGPHPVWTRKVLDELESAKAKATFFVIARKAEEHPEIVREIARRGHGVGLHSYAHDRFFSMRVPSRIKADLERGVAALERITGARPELFRPPIGHTTPAIARIADELDLDIVGWSVGGLDGLSGAVPERVAARVRAGLADGAIVLLHDAPERGNREPAGVRALPEILLALRERGLDIVSLDGWL
jgi:peptidoglycan/xylan/chitin deacetylase (PgdA/CDA1 family)